MAGKVLQILANGDPLPRERPHHELLNKMVHKHSNRLNNAINNLLVSDTWRGVMMTSDTCQSREETQLPKETLRPDPLVSENSLIQCLQRQLLSHRDYVITQHHRKFALLMSHVQSTEEYRLAMHRKETETFIYYKKSEVCHFIIINF